MDASESGLMTAPKPPCPMPQNKSRPIVGAPRRQRRTRRLWGPRTRATPRRPPSAGSSRTWAFTLARRITSPTRATAADGTCKSRSRNVCGAGCSRAAYEFAGTYSTLIYAARAVAVIERHAASAEARGLFVYLAFQAVHAPEQVPAEYSARYAFAPVAPSPNSDARDAYAGMLTCLDEGVGNVTRTLRGAALARSTLVWFQTDNDDPTPACGGVNGGQNWPLRGGKCTAWEGGLRGVAIASGAGVRGGRTERSLFHTIDVLPTLLEALGGDAVAVGAKLELGRGIALGIALAHARTRRAGQTHDRAARGGPLCEPGLESPARLCLPRRSARNAVLRTAPPGLEARPRSSRRRRWGRGRAPPGHRQRWCTGPPRPADHNNSASVAGPFGADSVMLFDVSKDPAETRDVSAAHPEVAAQLTAMMQELNATAVDSSGAFRPRDPRQDPALNNGTCGPYDH